MVRKLYYFRTSIAMLKTKSEKVLGPECAIFLQEVAYSAEWGDWDKPNEKYIATGESDTANFRDGRYWIPATLNELQERYPFWTKAQIRKIISRCRENGYLFTRLFDDDPTNGRTWFAVSDEVLTITN